MARVRILGPRERLDPVLRAVQDFGELHLADLPPRPGIAAASLDLPSERRRRQLTGVLEDAEGALSALDASGKAAADSAASVRDFARWARLARRTRREARALADRETALGEERALIGRYHDFLAAVLPVVRKVAASPRLTSHAVVIPAAARGTVDQLAAALRSEVGREFAMTARPLDDGDIALLLVLPKAFSEQLEARLAEARVPEVPLPQAYAGMPLDEAVPKMIARLDAIPREITGCQRQRVALAQERGPELRRARAAIHDWLRAAGAHEKCAVTRHAFTIEGWLPERDVAALGKRIAAVGDPVVVETIAREAWSADDAPVVLTNPRLFRPFEALLALYPLPRYGTIDPTPFVAVFFPMIFGMMLGDVGYGAILAILALLIHRRAAPGSIWRTIAEIAGPCAAFSIIFGAFFGEMFGDLGQRLFHIPAIGFNREQAMIATLAAAVGLGVVHVVLGLVLGAISDARREPRHALGRGVSAVMVLLVVAALLSAFRILPQRLLSPAVIALFIAFPVLIFAEGLIAPVELLGTLGNILSYARIMAIGTASVMLAVVANQMVGTIGGTLIGLVFALLFHLVNFAIGVFSPAIHTLRLHYVEFFGKFYSPGGRRYEPFGHWTPSTGR
jgi:V/A-type H+/Na+-transporting ATPase subunit I